MNAKKFSDAMSELDTKYVDEALNYKKKAKKPIWVKWGAIAACLCLMIPLTAFAVDIIQYNAAVDYLNSLGIAVEDLSDYSHKEIKEAAKTIDAGESNPLTEEILSLIPENKEPLDTPTPAQVVGQILGGDPVEAVHPSFQPTVVGVDVLHMESVVHHPNPGAEVNGLMGDLKLLGQGHIDGAAVGAKYRIGVQDRLQDGTYRLGIGALQNRIGGRRGTVAGDQHRDLFVRQPPFGRLAAPLARWARQVAAAFERFEEVGLVRFHNALQMRWLGPGQCGQKPVPPTE